MTANENSSKMKEEVKEYIEYLEKEKSSDQTISNYSGRINKFLKSNNLDEVTIKKLKEAAEKENSELISSMEDFASSRNDSYAMKSYLDYIKSEKTTNVNTRGMINAIKDMLDPSTSGRSSSEEEKIKSKIYPKDEIKTLIEKAPEYGGLEEEELRLYLRVMYYTGGRNDDIARLEWRDVLQKRWTNPKTEKRHDLRDKPKFIIHKNRSKSKSTGIVSLPEEVWDELMNLKESRKEELSEDEDLDKKEQVFFPEEDRGDRKFHQKINYIFRQSKEKDLGYYEGGPSPHCFRHSRLTHMGMDMLDEDESYEDIRTELAKYGRHEDGSTTDIYITKVKEESGSDFSKYTSLEV